MSGDGDSSADAAPGADRSVPAPLREYVPGLLALLGLALAARLIGAAVPRVSPLLAAVALGIVVANGPGVPAALDPGVGTYKLWLESGIVLLGARVSLDALLAAGVELAAVVALGVTATVLLIEGLSRSLGVGEKLGSLLAAGAGICGVSAVLGVAGAIRADEEQVAYAAGTILLFDVVTLFVYPVLSNWLGLADRVFGVWAGLTMFSTGPVTAAGFAVSETAGQWATVTKLARNLLLGALVGGYSVAYARREGESGAEAVSPGRLWASFPKFVLGFFAVMVFTSTAAVSPGTAAELTDAYRWLFLLAFAGLGLSVDAVDLRETGAGPVALVLTALLTVSAGSLVVVRALFG